MPASQNPLKLYLLPVLDERLKFPTAQTNVKLPSTVIICEGLLLIFADNDEKWLLLKNMPISRLDCKNHTLIMTEIAEI